MTVITDHAFSQRGWSNVEAVMPKIKKMAEERSKKDSPNIDLATAENWLIRPELIRICENAIVKDLASKHFSYPRGLSGDPDLLEAYASFFNQYFNPHRKVQASHLATAPGASGCIDALLYSICDPGDGVLLPGPYWNGFDFGIRARSSVMPVLVPVCSLNSNFTAALVEALEDTIRTSDRTIKALMLTNPHNPLAVCYPKRILEECLRFCQRHDLHFISDEVYALSQFDNPEIASPIPFTSILSIDLASIEVEAHRVHMIWSVSKDFGQSGLRMGVTVSQGNDEMIVALALAANTLISSLSTIFVTRLLTLPDLPSLIALNSERLSKAYVKLTTFFKEYRIPYYPCNAGIYVWARMAPRALTSEEETAFVMGFKQAGVLVSAGQAYHSPGNEMGWVRIGFAVEPPALEEAIRRMKSAYESMNSTHLRLL